MTKLHLYLRYTLLVLAVCAIVACHTGITVGEYAYDNREVMPAVGFSADTSLATIIAPYKMKLEAEMNRVVVLSSMELISKRPESLLTNLVADLLLEQANAQLKQQGRDITIDFSLVNTGGLRTALPKGEISVGKVFELMPFENEVVVECITGQTVKALFDVIAARGGEGISGASFVIKGDKAANIQIAGKPLVENGCYWVVTSDYVVNGGDNMKPLLNYKERIGTGVKVRDMIFDYFREQHKKGIKLSAKLDGRIRYE